MAAADREDARREVGVLMTDQEVRDALVRLASGQWLDSRERQLVVRAMESEKTRADELAAKLESICAGKEVER